MKCFNNNELNIVANEFLKEVDEIALSLDKISNDIKKVEAMLISCPLKNYVYKMEDGKMLILKDKKLYFSSNEYKLTHLNQISITNRLDCYKHLSTFMKGLKERCHELNLNKIQTNGKSTEITS